jgi:hypothetical protein
MEVSMPGDPKIGPYYFVTWSRSTIVDCNVFYEQLKMRLPRGTSVYGGQERHGDFGETGVVDYHAVFVVPYIGLNEPWREEYLAWCYPTTTVVVENLRMIVQSKNSEVGQNGDVLHVDDICVQVPERYHWGPDLPSLDKLGQYRDLSTFSVVTEKYIEQSCGDFLFGHRIDAKEVRVKLGNWKNHVRPRC